MKRNFVLMLICLLLMSCSVRRHPGEFTETRVMSEKGLTGLTVADMNGDSEEELLLNIHNPGYDAVRICNTDLSVYSQANAPGIIRGIHAMDIDGDGDEELFVSSVKDSNLLVMQYHDYTWKTPLERKDHLLFTMKKPHTYPALYNKSWYGQLYPKAVTDLDGNGLNDILFLGYAGYYAYPRGIWVFEEKTHREVWNYPIGANINSLFINNQDPDAPPKIIITTRSYKNSVVPINGTDDQHSYLIMLDASGKKLDQITLAQGYSDLPAHFLDLNHDGQKELIVAKLTWNNNHEKAGIYIYDCSDSHFRLLRKREVEGQYFCFGGFLVDDMNNDGMYEIFVVNSQRKIEVFDGNLQPVTQLEDHSYHRLFAIADINADGERELLVMSEEGVLYAFNPHYQLQATLKDNNLSNSSLVLRNTGYGKPKELIARKNEQIRFFRYHTTLLYSKNLQILGIIAAICLGAFLLWMGMLVVRYFFIFRRLMATTPVGSALFFSTGKILWSNPEFTRQFHALNASGTKQTPYLHTILELAKKLSRKHPTLQHSMTFSSGTSAQVHFTIVSLFPRVFSLYSIDTTDAAALKKKLYWADLTRGVSHGIRKHVNNIILANQQLKQIGGESTEAITDIFQQEADKLHYFIRSFQRFSELDALTLLPTDICPIVKNVVENHPHRREITITVSCEENLPKVLADAVRLEEILHDLLDNAVEAIPGAGVITIVLDGCETLQDASGVQLVLMDTGTGIQPDILEHITKPYFTTKADGTGIGIPRAIKTIEAFGGTIDIQSKPDLGTTITLFIPGVHDEKDSLS